MRKERRLGAQSKMTEINFKYRGFGIRCQPIRIPEGGFGAHVTIVGGAEHPFYIKYVPDIGYFHTEASALEQSMAWGRNWVDEQIGATQAEALAA